jgi:hypothetical protein
VSSELGNHFSYWRHIETQHGDAGKDIIKRANEFAATGVCKTELPKAPIADPNFRPAVTITFDRKDGYGDKKKVDPANFLAAVKSGVAPKPSVSPAKKPGPSTDHSRKPKFGFVKIRADQQPPPPPLSMS